MESFKQFAEKLKSKLKAAVDSGSIFTANEITANLMVGLIILIMMFIMLLSLGANEFGLFSANTWSMRYAAIACIAFLLPAEIMCKRYHGDHPKLKDVLFTCVILQCLAIACCLGHNVAMIMVIPPLLSVRYYDEKFSRKIVYLSVAAMFVATFGNLYYGISNLNVFSFDPGTTITVSTTLHEAIDSMGMEYEFYIASVMKNELLPKLLLFSVVGMSCIMIAKRGKQMIDLQAMSAKESSRVETELNLATQIQTGMLPCIFPAFPAHEQLDLFATNKPAKEVGGDFYDYFNVDDDHVAIVMADVSGKGVGAALFMTISKIVIKNEIQTCGSVAEALSNANATLCENNQASLFVTVWAGILDTKTGKMTYSSAGHNPPCIRHNGDEGFHYLKGRRGMVLAGIDGSFYQENSIQLDPGDEIFLYTDGVTEATNCENELYGEARLLESLDKCFDRDMKGQVEFLKQDILKFMGGAEQFDDITVLALRVNKTAENDEQE